ncbi:MAG: phosphoribosyl-AMP cyclohydrolase [Rhodospirillales bacterium]|nr:phosphoribosyl-AMP cyclohydrolase [Rhodospirillales bacterium]MCB9964573.1 phosphoribosyl-AMP cyclohydrolase [Rhodospirillales bacterium]MCB9973904.1 phosphoribosyl-AMP cyclohydrolase [Rhodospirillales bacterium]MCB9980529.1 phosphoribosyl-AMP cyclohydrolase [Rhodospirillales bacterium]
MKSFRDEASDFLPQWNEQGLIPAIAQDIHDKEIKMMAWMNEESLKLTLETGFVHYWARTRKKIWKKGEESGHVQKLVELRVDCDQDCLLLLIEQTGPACHTDRPTCFYRRVTADGGVSFLYKPPASQTAP